MGKYRTYEENMEEWRNSSGCWKFITVLIMIIIGAGMLYGCISCMF